MAVKVPQKFPGMTHATFVSSGNGTEVFSTNAPSGNILSLSSATMGFALQRIHI